MPEETLDDQELQAALDEARGEDLPAAQLRQMRDVLLRRRAMLSGEIENASDHETREKIKKQIEELDGHVAILHEEAALTGFVEDAVRFSVKMSSMHEE